MRKGIFYPIGETVELETADAQDFIEKQLAKPADEEVENSTEVQAPPESKPEVKARRRRPQAG